MSVYIQYAALCPCTHILNCFLCRLRAMTSLFCAHTPLCCAVILIVRRCHWTSFLHPSPLQLQDAYSNSNSSSGTQQCVSQPATPGGALPVPSPLSPSPASLSSYHGDDSDSISSPPWPLKTPSSPVRPRSQDSSGWVVARWITDWLQDLQ